LYVPHIESLKQLFVLLNCLAPQVFRPIDFIILSFFEISKPYLTSENTEISNDEMNNWLCIVIVHIYLLLSYTSEEQILIRLHHLMPQIISSYNESIQSSTTTLNNQNFKSSSTKSNSSSSVYSSSSSSSLLRSSPSSRNHSAENKSSDEEKNPTALTVTSKEEDKNADSESESNQRHRSASISTSYSNNTSTSNSSYNKNNAEYTDNKQPPNDGSGYYNDDTELDLNESAIFMAKFLLKLIEKSLHYTEKTLKFNSNSYFSTNLSASAPSSLLRDFQTNFYRDMNYTQHLIANNLLFLMYIISSGVYPKISNSIALLINDKAKETDTKYSKFFINFGRNFFKCYHSVNVTIL
jgi:hypothetical protein